MYVSGGDCCEMRETVARLCVRVCVCVYVVARPNSDQRSVKTIPWDSTGVLKQTRDYTATKGPDVGRAHLVLCVCVCVCVCDCVREREAYACVFEF